MARPAAVEGIGGRSCGVDLGHLAAVARGNDLEANRTGTSAAAITTSYRQNQRQAKGFYLWHDTAVFAIPKSVQTARWSDIERCSTHRPVSTLSRSTGTTSDS